MKTIFKLLLLAVVFTSCDDVEPTVFNGMNESNDTFLSFSRGTYNLQVERDLTGEVVVTVNASTVSSVDRTYTLEVIPGDSEFSADPATYSVPATVTIPAGSYQGTFTISGTDGGLVDAERKNFTIRLTGLNGEYIDDDTITVNVFEVCSLFDDFSGNYTITMPSLSLTGTPLIANGVYNLQEGESVFERIITVTSPYADYGLPATEFVLSLACGKTSFSNLPYDTGLACQEGGPYLVIDNTTLANAGTYDPEDDSTFTVKVIENSSSACNGSPVTTTIQFTKVE